MGTIQSFCKRAAAESSDKYWLKHVKNHPQHALPASPPWSKWVEPKELDSFMETLQRDAQAAASVLSSERSVTMELRKLSDLGVYPTAELALIRKEYRSLEEEWAAGP